MFRNYLKIAVRNLLRQKLFSSINSLGLSVGIAISFIILLYVKQETSYDSFHRDCDRIFRVIRIGDLNDEKYDIGVTSGPYAEGLINDFPEEIDQTLRVYLSDGLVRVDDRTFFEEKFFLADSNFLDVFSYSLKIGNRETALDLPNSVIITERIARKYFGSDDPIGKLILVDEELEFVVSGVFEESPAKSHLDFDFVANISLLNNFSWFGDWWNNNLMTYVVLKDQTNANSLEARFPAFMDKYFGEDFQEMGRRIDIKMEPLSDIYFNSETRYDEVLHGNISSVYIFSGIAVFLILIACINFVNLATAKSFVRAKEVGIRKTLGSSKNNLVIQFLLESFTLVSFSAALAVFIVTLLLPYINQQFGIELSLGAFPTVFIIGSVLILVLVTSVLSGSYPAFLLSGYKIVKVLKGNLNLGDHTVSLRKTLFIIQCSVSVLLILITVIAQQQLSFISNRDLGFDKEETILLRVNNQQIRDNQQTLVERIRRLSGVKSVSLGTGEPGGFHDTSGLEVEGQDDQVIMRTLYADEHYLNTFSLDLLKGRNFSEDRLTDRTEALIVNEEAVRQMGFNLEEALHKKVRISLWDSTYRTIIGVVEDYHFSSLKDKINPLLIAYSDRGRIISIKTNGGKSDELVSELENIWNGFSPAYPMNYEFLDEKLSLLYENERVQSSLFKIFSSISIFVACLGVFGLAGFSVNQRVKEISIRKVLGASVSGLAALLSKDFVRLTLTAVIVSIPIGWYLIDRWLSQFAYAVDLSPWVFILSSISLIVIVIAPVMFQALKASLVNPIESLRRD